GPRKKKAPDDNDPADDALLGNPADDKGAAENADGTAKPAADAKAPAPEEGEADEEENGEKRKKMPESKLTNPPSVHAKSLNDVQRFFVEETRLGIPVDFTNEG